MGQWIEPILLAAGYCLVLSTVEGQVTTNLTVCEGDAADFPNSYSLGDYRRVFFTVQNTGGKSLDMYRLNFDDTKPTIHGDYKERFSLKSPSEVGFTIKNVGTTDAGNYSCLIAYLDGTKKRFKWNLQVKDSTSLSKPSIYHKFDSDCKTYLCENSETVEVETSWLYSGGKVLNGRFLKLCKDNKSTDITCTIKTFCSNNHTAFYDCPTRHKRRTSSASPGEASDDCDGDTGSAIEEDKQNTGMGAGIGIGFSIASVLALIAVLAMVYLYKRRKAAKDYNKDEIKENGIVMPLVHCIQEESRGDCKK